MRVNRKLILVQVVPSPPPLKAEHTQQLSQFQFSHSKKSLSDLYLNDTN